MHVSSPPQFGGVNFAHPFSFMCFYAIFWGFCLSSFCVWCTMLPVSGLSILNCTFDFLSRLCKQYENQHSSSSNNDDK
jgi:hypothetical protein